MDKDLEFLTRINKKLHGIQEGIFEPNLSGNAFKVYFDTYTNENMNHEEIEKVLEIAKKPKFVIYPINTAMGFSVGYDVCKININGKRKILLRFKEEQLPEGYSFKKMAKIFMEKTNRMKAKLIGEEIVNDYDYYDY